MPPFDLDSAEGRDWLRTDDGRDWLETDAGVDWLVTPVGEDWMGSRDGRAWTDARDDARWETYFSGKKLPIPPPEWAMTPDIAPRVGDRVRVSEDASTPSGVEFSEGELGIVTEARFTPMGVVFVTVRMLDGRKRITGMRDTLRPAT